MTIGMQLLKHTKFYWVGTEKVQFKAETRMETYFKVAVAKFIFPDKSVVEAWVKPFTNELVGAEALPFTLEFTNSTWKANLREAI